MAYNDREAQVLEDKKLSLFGEKGSKGMPRMFFNVTENGNPACLVFPNDENDTERKPIRGAMDPVIWSTFVAVCKDVFSGSTEQEFRLDLRAGKPNNTFTDSFMVVGKDAEGICYLALIKKDRAKKRFNMLPTVYMDLINKDGSPVPRGVVSTHFALGYIDAVDAAVKSLINKLYKPYVPPEQGGGGGNRQSQQSSAGGSFEDDIPF